MGPAARIDHVASLISSWIDFEYAYTLQDVWDELGHRRRFDKSIYFPEDHDELRAALRILTERGRLQARDLSGGRQVWCRPGVDAEEKRMTQLEVAITNRVDFRSWQTLADIERTLERKRRTEDADSSGPYHAFPVDREETRAVLRRLARHQVLIEALDGGVEHWRLRLETASAR